MNPFWSASIPIWVSRKTASGDISTFNVSGWFFMLIWSVGLINALAWGCIGIYEAARFVL